MGEHDIEIVTPLQGHAFLDTWYDLTDESHFWFEWRLRALLRQLADLPLATDRPSLALDIGCGTGVLRTQMERHTLWTVDATDLDYRALQRAKPGRGRTLYYDVVEQRADFKARYDILMLFDVVEHIERPVSFLQALPHHLKPGGLLLVNVPALPALHSRYDDVVGHFRRYTIESLSQEIEASGLRVLDARYWGFTNVPLLFGRKIWLDSLRVRKEEQVVRNGFEPPNRWINSLFMRLLRIETGLLPRPPLGSSVLLAARNQA